MKKFQILLWFLPILNIAHGHPSIAADLPEDQIEEVLALYRKHCKPTHQGGYGPGESLSGGYGSSYGVIPPTVSVVCKEGMENYELPKKQIIRIPGEKAKKQIVFVEAPQIKVKHNINFIPPKSDPRTVIYVLPQKSSHQIKVWDKREPPRNGVKPSVYYLRGDRQDSPRPIYGLPQQPVDSVAAAPPAPIYGTPSTTGRPPSGAYGGYQEPSSNFGPQYEIISTNNDNGIIRSTQESSGTFVQSLGGGGSVRPVPRVKFYDTPGNGNRVIFPSESIQSYQVQSFDGRKHESQVAIKEESEDLTDFDAQKSLKSFIAGYEKRQGSNSTTSAMSTTINPISSTSTTENTTTSTTTLASTTTSQPSTTTSTTPTPTSSPAPSTSTEAPRSTPEGAGRLNIFDENYVKNLISSSRENNNNYITYYNSNETPLSYTGVGSPSSSYVPFKRSIESPPSFEMFPANFVSYSYSHSKVDE